jgi:hypothetical protein
MFLFILKKPNKFFEKKIIQFFVFNFRVLKQHPSLKEAKMLFKVKDIV